MGDVEISNKKQQCKRNKYIKAIDSIGMYLLKSLCVAIGFTISVVSFVAFTSVAIVIATVCGLGYAACEIACNLKDLSVKFFGKGENILDYYYDMEKIKDLKAVMESSKDVQNYLSQSNSSVIIDKNARALEKRDNRPNIIELPHNLDTMDISK